MKVIDEFRLCKLNVTRREMALKRPESTSRLNEKASGFRSQDLRLHMGNSEDSLMDFAVEKNKKS